MNYLHCNKSITFDTGGQNDMKKQENLIKRYLSLKFFCNEIIKTLGLHLQRNMSGVFFYC